MNLDSRHNVTERVHDPSYGTIPDGEENALLAVDESSDIDIDKNRDIPLSKIPNLWLIEAALFTNVFLAGFDGTVTATTYQTIGNEFNHTNISNWITTAYLITSTAFQPLYGSFSDVLGRRSCLFFASSIFGIGCLACGLSTNIYMLSFMRALTGIGGGGLITLSTIVNSDVIPCSKRALFQAFQNLLLGLGAIFGASFGGSIASTVGWRWCFFTQVPISVINLFLMGIYVPNQEGLENETLSKVIHPKRFLSDIDIAGSILIIVGLSLQLLYLSIGCNGNVNENMWRQPSSLVLLVSSVVVLTLFLVNEKRTTATAILPLDLVTTSYGFVVLVISILVGFASYAYLFTLPLFFQIVLGDSAAKAGLRLTIPSLFTPIGSFITGVCMSKFNCLSSLLYAGIFLMFLGNFLFLLINNETPNWLIGIFLIPANLGQGITFPTTLFTFIFAFSKKRQATATSTLYLFRSTGSVWGVAISSGVVQVYATCYLQTALRGLLNEDQITQLITHINANTSYIRTLRGEVKSTVVKGFELGTQRAHLLSTLLSLLALILCFIKGRLKKPLSRG